MRQEGKTLRTTTIGWLVGIALLAGCNGKLFTITLEQSAVTEVARGTLVEELVGDLGFGDFLEMNLVEAEELQNQGVEPGDIKEVYMNSFELEATAPSGVDLSFLDSMELLVESPGLDEVSVARQDTFPEGQALVPFEVEDVDLTEYLVSESLTISTDVTARRPDQDTTVEARFVLEVGVTTKGLINQTKR